ncbi:MAG: anhydro-N-acetylmuramic acid kinase [Stappiaceae bacterium]
MTEPVWAVGLMTGTVLDGDIDVALIRTDGVSVQEFGHFALKPYRQDVNKKIAEAFSAAQSWQFDQNEPDVFTQAEHALTKAQSEAVRDVVIEAGLSMKDIAIIGFHGQTVLHRAPTSSKHGQTRQLGDGKLMADCLQTPVAFDFRSADMAAGGQGAPLSSIYHAALLRKMNADLDTAVLNLGGVANLTWTDGRDSIVGFDTGPANAPINDWMNAHGLGAMDRNGATAKKGLVDEDRLKRLLDHPYLLQPFPKSLDRNDFTADMAEGLSLEDGAATLTAFTAAAVGRALDVLPHRPRSLILCGGGRKNPTLVTELRQRAKITPKMSEDYGWRGDALEAECFAYLAVRVQRNLPISFPGTTGVPAAMCGGRLAEPCGPEPVSM